MQGLYRTHAGFQTHYMVDGYGRDSYIMHNNGGVSRVTCVVPSTRNRSSKHGEYSPPAPFMPPKTRKYLVNGSGRDSYISNHSTTSEGYRPYHHCFRENQKIRYVKGDDVFTNSQRNWRKARTLRRSWDQDNHISRLSVPKMISIPFEKETKGTFNPYNSF